MSTSVSTAWLDLFAEDQAPDAESCFKSYDALDTLDGSPGLSFLKDLIWAEIRTWVANNTDSLSPISHDDLDGPGRVFLGGMNHALNDDTLREHDISAAISIHPKDLLAWHPADTTYALRRFSSPASPCSVKHHLMVPLEDKANADLMGYFDQTNDFLATNLRAGRNILVHCKSGRSRSVAAVIAYLQRKYYDATIRPQDLALDEALSKMVAYREAVTESIRVQRLPVLIIMERFEDLLRLYDFQLLGHPAYEERLAHLFSPPPPSEKKLVELHSAEARAADSQTAGAQKLSSQGTWSEMTRSHTIDLEHPAGLKRVKKKGGAAILKLAVAIVFFKNNQKPPVAVVERLFEINEAYFWEMEGVDFQGVDYRDSGHIHRGICAFYDRFADEYGYEAPTAVSQLSD
ncbi:putative dual specificity phosphatase [Diaporthe ampelina]|uniref:protein-tyrosine-phosphatase n=1 Tax=Diaporthe ampelina TaxID=1214573 RepID=A0A0G2FUD6_9PEZI|nr:putative dual specificity phosphatase [Diaporthe ampelina]